MSPIPVHLVIEDDLSEFVVRRLLINTNREYSVGTAFGRTGFGYLRSSVSKWNAAAAAGTPIILLTDLDQNLCAPSLINDWLGGVPHPNLIFRVAVREVEAWILADRDSLSRFFRISAARIPLQPDQLPDPKQTLINLARRSRVTAIRDSIVPRRGSTAIQGPDYNGALGEFVRDHWNSRTAMQHSPSLRSAWTKFMAFEPRWRI
jgi:hypothetical protein